PFTQFAAYIVRVAARSRRSRADASGRQRDRPQRRAAGALDPQRGQDQQRDVRLRVGEWLEVGVLHDVDAAVGEQHHVNAEELLAVRGRALLERRGVVAREPHALVDDPARAVPARPGRLLAEIRPVVLGEVLAPARADHHRIALAHFYALSLRRLLEVRAGDLEAGRKRVWTATRHLPRDVQEDHAVHHQVGREAVDPEIRPDAGRRGRRGDCIDPAVELEVAPDVADRVDGRRAVLAAEVHDVRRPGHAAARRLTGDLVRHLVGPVERERVGRVEAEHGRLLVPREGEVEHPRALHGPDQLVGRGTALRRRRARERRDTEGYRRAEPPPPRHVVHALLLTYARVGRQGPAPTAG